MEGRCVVDTWTQFGFSGARTAAKLLRREPHVFICDGSHQVYVFNTKERKLTALLHLPAAATDLVESLQLLLYVACASGVYCVNLQRLLDRTERSSAVHSSSGPAELKISAESRVAEAAGASSLLLAGSLLVTLGQRDSSWLLTLHQTQSSRCERLRSFVLPAVRLDVESGPRRGRRGRGRPVLICLHCADATPPSSSPDSSEATLPRGHFRLQPVLFKLLFGVEAALANSPVILCGLPDGRLVFLPLRLPAWRLSVLHSLEQPVVEVAASPTAEPARCLVALGERGRLVLITAEEGGGGQLSFTEACVPAPVSCGRVDGHCLYYSTGADLLALELSRGWSRGGGRGRDEEAAAALRSPTSLNVCRVAALAEASRCTAGGVELLGLSTGGRLQTISLPVQWAEPGSNMLASTQAGHRLGDLLSAIGDVCGRASSLETVIKSKNQILKHLNQVMNVSVLQAGGGQKPVRCHGRTSWSRLLQKPRLTLTCVLENCSPFVLDGGWTLSLAVLPLSLPASAGGQSPSQSFSFPFHRLSSGESLEVSLPVAEVGNASFPLTVNCSLVFSLSSLLRDEEAGIAAALPSGSLSVPLNTLTVDWLHGLQLPGLRAVHAAAPGQCSTDTASHSLNLFDIGRSRRPDGGGEGASKPETYSACVRVSSALVNQTLTLSSSGSDATEQRTAPRDLRVSLLDWLLSGGGGGVKREHREDARGAVVHGCGPNGAAVRLSAAEVDVGAEPLPTIQVGVESSSLAAVCGLHHAVLRRIQILLQNAPEKTSSTPIQSSGLRRALQRAEMHQTRISAALGATASAGQMNQRLLAVYRELRGNPLLVV